MSNQSGVENQGMELAHRIRSGDALSFDLFFDLYFPKIYNYIYSRVEDHRETEELVDRVFRAAVGSLEYFDDTLPLDLWMHKIACSVVPRAPDRDTPF